MKAFPIVFAIVLCGCGGSEQNNQQVAAPDPEPSKPTPPTAGTIPTKPPPPTAGTIPTKPPPTTTKPKPINPVPTTTKPEPTKPSGKSGGAAGQSEQILQQRWALLTRTTSRGQWPNYQVIQQNLGQPDRQKQNVTMNTRAILTPSPATRGAGAVSPVARFSPIVSPCVRWDYFGDSKGQQSIQLYLFKGALVGYQWINNSKNNQSNKPKGQKTGANKSGSKGTGQGGKNQPNVGAGQSQQILQRRWASLVGSASRGQWPNYRIVQQNLGQPHQQKQNVTMNTRAILGQRDGKGIISPAARFSPIIPRCVRWDYSGDPKGKETIQLYFSNGALVGFQWVKSGKNNQGNKTQGGKNRKQKSRQ